MKELSIEEKAKRFDEALESARECYFDGLSLSQPPKAIIEHIFPELAESEDERIRKQLLELVNDFTGDSLWVDYNIHKEDALAWLEKQGEQKSNPCENCSIATNNCQKFPCAIRNGKQKPAWSEDDEEIYKKIETAIDSYYAPFSRDTEEMQEWFKNLKKRIQSQQRRGEEEKHKLMKKCVDRAYQSGYDTGCKLTKKEMEHNSQWSEEDENWLINAINVCELHDYNETAEWLISLKERYTWKPSDEQMVALKCAITTADEKWVYMNTKDLKSLYEDLKRLLKI